MANSKDNFFEKFGLELTDGEVEVGKTYPIYGMVTNILEEGPTNVVAEINFSIKARMIIPEQEKIELLKERAFEPAIFVSTVLSKGPEGVEVECSTVVFGRKQYHEA